MAERLSAATCELQLSLTNVSAESYLGFMPQPSQKCATRARRNDLLTELAGMARESRAQGEWLLLQRLAALARE